MNPLLSHYICIESDFFQELGEKIGEISAYALRQNGFDTAQKELLTEKSQSF